MPLPKLVVASRYMSLEGETTLGGPLQFTEFLRLGGCNLRCYSNEGGCDTPQALPLESPNYHLVSQDELLGFYLNRARTMGRHPKRLTITGGEPLLQISSLIPLVLNLRDSEWSIQVETNGTVNLTLSEVAMFNCIIADLKTPSTGMQDIPPVLIPKLREQDFVKVVIASIDEMDWAVGRLQELGTKAQVAVGTRALGLSPAYSVRPSWIVECLRMRGLYHWRLNMQLHKEIWPDAKGEV